MITVLCVETGEVAEIPEKIFRNRTFFDPEKFVEVEEGTKPYVGYFKPRTVEEFTEDHPEKVKKGRKGKTVEPEATEEASEEIIEEEKEQ